MGALQLGQRQSTADFLFKVKALPAALATAPIIDSSFQQAFAQ